MNRTRGSEKTGKPMVFVTQRSFSHRPTEWKNEEEDAKKRDIQMDESRVWNRKTSNSSTEEKKNVGNVV